MEDLNKIPKKNKNLAWRIIDGEAVIIPLEKQLKENEAINILNQTATRIWQLCNGKNTIREVIAQLKQEYAAGSKEIESAVQRLIQELMQQKLITI